MDSPHLFNISSLQLILLVISKICQYLTSSSTHLRDPSMIVHSIGLSYIVVKTFTASYKTHLARRTKWDGIM